MATPFLKVEGHSLYVPLIASRPTVVDVGANHGGFAAELLAITSGARFVLVEPNAELARELRGSFAGHRVLPCALATADGPIQFNMAKNDQGSSLLTLPVESAFDCTLDRTEMVEGYTLDRLLGEIGAPYVDVLKLDAEGAELLVLPDMTADQAGRIGQITVEFHSDPVFGFGREQQARAAWRQLESLGFAGFDFTVPGQPRWSDVLFVNRRRAAWGLATAYRWKAYANLLARYRKTRRRWCAHRKFSFGTAA